MNTIIIPAILQVQSGSAPSGSKEGYLIGGIIAILILAYLIYTLLRPEKF
jgi:K+-transporting ATPase KdpF subunit